MSIRHRFCELGVLDSDRRVDFESCGNGVEKPYAIEERAAANFSPMSGASLVVGVLGTGQSVCPCAMMLAQCDAR